MAVHEVNFDGLVGPTHNYAGLSPGNLASLGNRGRISNPRAAALQGLAKMKFLADLGLKQAFLPPQPRPCVPFLRAHGFSGSDVEVVAAAARRAPRLLAVASSASSMWAANAATVAPSADTGDGRVHFTPANLVANAHRRLEAAFTTRVLRAIFADPACFVVHDPLPPRPALGDEGAANHTRLAPTHAHRGVNFFVYGRTADTAPATRFPARQTLAASRAVARRHELDRAAVVLARQHPAAVRAGVFHNDVIAVGNENVLLHHEHAWVDTPRLVATLRRRFVALDGAAELVVVTVPAKRVSLREAVASYLFNSQLVTVAPGRMALIAPVECGRTPRVRDYLEELVADGTTPISEVHYLDLRQSMRNGGGPACLRLRVVLTDDELTAVPRGVLFNDAMHRRLIVWVQRHYRERLTPRDLADPELARESARALAELAAITGVPAWVDDPHAVRTQNRAHLGEYQSFTRSAILCEMLPFNSHPQQP